MSAAREEILAALALFGEQEEKRAYADFRERNGREYDGMSDDDWDDLDKSYTAIDEAMNLVRGVI